MRVTMIAAAALVLLCSLPLARSSDGDPLQDVCVGDLASGLRVNGLLCKDMALLDAQDFVFRGLRGLGGPNSSVASSPTGVTRTLATALEFPALNTQGASLVRVDFEPGGVNPPHIHPRASEIGFVMQGTFYSGFVTSTNQLFAQVIHQGDIMLFPRGLVHFQLNLSPDHGVLIGFLNSQNPSTVSLPTTLFGTDINDDVLRKAFQMSEQEVKSLKAKFQKPKAD